MHLMLLTEIVRMLEELLLLHLPILLLLLLLFCLLLLDGGWILEFLTGLDNFSHIENLSSSTNRLKTISTRPNSAEVDEIQEAAEDVRRDLRILDFDSRIFEIVIRPKIDDGIEEISALCYQFRHVSHEDGFVVDINLQIVI